MIQPSFPSASLTSQPHESPYHHHSMSLPGNVHLESNSNYYPNSSSGNESLNYLPASSSSHPLPSSSSSHQYQLQQNQHIHEQQQQQYQQQQQHLYHQLQQQQHQQSSAGLYHPGDSVMDPTSLLPSHDSFPHPIPQHQMIPQSQLLQTQQLQNSLSQNSHPLSSQIEYTPTGRVKKSKRDSSVPRQAQRVKEIKEVKASKPLRKAPVEKRVLRKIVQPTGSREEGSGGEGVDGDDSSGGGGGKVRSGRRGGRRGKVGSRSKSGGDSNNENEEGNSGSSTPMESLSPRPLAQVMLSQNISNSFISKYGSATFPVSRIKRMMKDDPETKGVTNDAAFALTIATVSYQPLPPSLLIAVRLFQLWSVTFATI